MSDISVSENFSFNGKTVLVTGAGGFIGSHLAEKLAARGARVRAMVRYKSDGGRGWLDRGAASANMEILSGDVTDSDSVRNAVKGCDIVFHLAALIAIPYSYVAPLSYQRVNVEGALNVLQAVREFGVARMIHTSTSETYGTARYVPIDESHPLQAQSPYSASKIGGDKLVESFHASFGTPVVTVRPFNTYGPRQSGRAVIPTIISQCLEGKAVKLGNLSPTRDFLYVDDTVNGFCHAALAPGADGMTINLGTGNEISISDLVLLIAEMTGTSANVSVERERVRPEGSEVERLLADSSLARSALHWSAAVDLREGLRRTIEWISANRQVYRPGEYTL